MGHGYLELNGKRWQDQHKKEICECKTRQGGTPLWDSAFTGIQNASEKPPISKSQGETGQAAKNMIKTRMDLSTVLVPVFMSTRNTLLTHLLAKHNQDTKNIPHVDWHF